MTQVIRLLLNPPLPITSSQAAANSHSLSRRRGSSAGSLFDADVSASSGHHTSKDVLAGDGGLVTDRLFSQIDCDKDGRISANDLRKTFRRLGVMRKRSVFEEFIWILDDQRKGHVDLQLFRRVFGPYMRTRRRKESCFVSRKTTSSPSKKRATIETAVHNPLNTAVVPVMILDLLDFLSVDFGMSGKITIDQCKIILRQRCKDEYEAMDMLTALRNVFLAKESFGSRTITFKEYLDHVHIGDVLKR